VATARASPGGASVPAYDGMDRTRNGVWTSRAATRWHGSPILTEVCRSPSSPSRRSPASAGGKSVDGGPALADAADVTGTAIMCSATRRVGQWASSYVGAGLRSWSRPSRPGYLGDPRGAGGVLPSGLTVRQHRAGLRQPATSGVAGTPRARPVGLTTRRGAADARNFQNGSGCGSALHANAERARSPTPLRPGHQSEYGASIWMRFRTPGSRSGPAAASRRPVIFLVNSRCSCSRSPTRRPARHGPAAPAVLRHAPLRMARRRLGRVPPRPRRHDPAAPPLRLEVEDLLELRPAPAPSHHTRSHDRVGAAVAVRGGLEGPEVFGLDRA